MSRSPGEMRRRKVKDERERLARETRLAELRAEGAACSICTHFETGSWHMNKRHICTLTSGGGAFTLTEPRGLCTQWNSRAAADGRG